MWVLAYPDATGRTCELHKRARRITHEPALRQEAPTYSFLILQLLDLEHQVGRTALAVARVEGVHLDRKIVRLQVFIRFRSPLAIQSALHGMDLWAAPVVLLADCVRFFEEWVKASSGRLPIRPAGRLQTRAAGSGTPSSHGTAIVPLGLPRQDANVQLEGADDVLPAHV